MEDIGKKIIKKFGGHPLAITVLSRGLVNFDDWEMMSQRLQGAQHLEIDKGIMAFSYYLLPFDLKPFFLYLGHFPTYQAIPVEKLCLLWLAEGLISRRGRNRTIRMEIAEDYFNQLVERGLVVLVEKDDTSVSTRFRSCQLSHDVIRELCMRRGEEENFFKIIDFRDRSSISSLTRSLAIYLDKFEDTNDVPLNIPRSKNIRSILFFDTDKSLHRRPSWPREFSDLEGFQGTRVLDFDGVDFRDKMLPKGVQKLIHLRYLSFQRCYLWELPSYISNFPFLEILDLRAKVNCKMTIPNVLWKLSSLRHLYFPLSFRSDKGDKLKLDSLTRLEILENFHAGVCNAYDLTQLGNLQILTAFVDGKKEDLENTIRSMNTISTLSRSSLVVKRFDSYSDEKFSIIESLLACNGLHALEVEGVLQRFPRSKGIAPNFVEMVFDGSEFIEDPMPILGRELPNLKILVLCNDAFVGNKMVCSKGDFPQLTNLKIASIHSLKVWEVESEAIPKLNVLVIEQCTELGLLADELMEISTLHRLMIGSMSQDFQNKVKMTDQKMKALGNAKTSITFYDR